MRPQRESILSSVSADGFLRSSVLGLVLPAAAFLAVPPSVLAEDSGYLGIGFSVDPDSGVLKVEQVVPGSPAEHAGVEVADEVLKIGQVETRFPSHRAALEVFADKARVGKPLVLTIRRDASLLDTKVIPGEFPASLASRNERALRCVDDERRTEAPLSRIFDSIP